MLVFPISISKIDKILFMNFVMTITFYVLNNLLYPIDVQLKSVISYTKKKRKFTVLKIYYKSSHSSVLHISFQYFYTYFLWSKNCNVLIKLCTNPKT